VPNLGSNKKYSLYRVTRYLKSSAYSSLFITFSQSQQALVTYFTHPSSLEMYIFCLTLDWPRLLLIYTNLKGILPRMMQICVIINTHLAYIRMTVMLYICHSGPY
jgi:hypothetical protein